MKINGNRFCTEYVMFEPTDFLTQNIVTNSNGVEFVDDWEIIDEFNTI